MPIILPKIAAVPVGKGKLRAVKPIDVEQLRGLISWSEVFSKPSTKGVCYEWHKTISASKSAKKTSSSDRPWFQKVYNRVPTASRHTASHIHPILFLIIIVFTNSSYSTSYLLFSRISFRNKNNKRHNWRTFTPIVFFNNFYFHNRMVYKMKWKTFSFNFLHKFVQTHD